MSTATHSGAYMAVGIPDSTRWAVVQQCPRTAFLTVVVDCATETAAREQAEAMNAERALLARLNAHFAPPRWRHTCRLNHPHLPGQEALL